MEIFTLLICLAIFAETTFLVSKKHRPQRTGRRKIYVDTSALIDGRILEIAKTGFIDGDFIILKSVLRELQLLADGKDKEKRNRARDGIDVASELERVINITTEILDDGGGHKKVDEELLKFARANKGAILTLDYNLIKIAEVEAVETLNINDLALAARVSFYPGDRVSVKIAENGSNRGQGVGHLPDGTMVVVDNAAKKIGQTVDIELLRLHETSSGKMFFAKIAKN